MSDPWAPLLDARWQDRVVLARPAPGVELGIGDYRLPAHQHIPLFTWEVDAAVSADGLDWAAVAEAVVYVLAHAPVGTHVPAYAAILEAWQPDITGYLSQQGVTLAQQGEWREALICLRAATVLAQDEAPLQYNLGVCSLQYAAALAAAGEKEKAEQAEAAGRLALRKAAVLDPEFEPALAAVLS